MRGESEATAEPAPGRMNMTHADLDKHGFPAGLASRTGRSRQGHSNEAKKVRLLGVG